MDQWEQNLEAFFERVDNSMRLHCLMLMLLLIPGGLAAANLAQEQRISEQLSGPRLMGEVRWLTTRNVRFLALFEQSNADRRLGGAILLHDVGSNADAPAVIGPLRRHLALRGWDTLSLQMPRPADPFSTADRDEAIALSKARLGAAVALFKAQKTTPLVLVGHGLGAEMALAYLAGNPTNDALALVTIGLAAGEGGETDPVLQVLARFPLPLLDLYGDRDRPEVLASAQARHGTAKRNGRERYRQDKVMGADHEFSGLQESLQRRVSSWLRRIVLGEGAAAP